MIGRIKGVLVAKQPPWLLVDVGGVGYEIEAPMSTVFALPECGQGVTLHTHFVVREDAQALYGFLTLAEKDLFRQLIRTSGVGPKLALAVLSGLGVADFWSAVRSGDALRLTKLPGIGRKTADRLIVELRDRADGAGSDAGAVRLSAAPMAPLEEARHALAALGYKPVEAQRLLDAVYADGMSTESIIQDALRRAVR